MAESERVLQTVFIPEAETNGQSFSPVQTRVTLLDSLVDWINPHYALLFALPLLVFLVNPNWLFQGFGHFDPWYYFGMSVDFPRYQHLERAYPAERLTWVLPARLFVILLSPTYGWMMYHLCLWWGAVFTVYSLMKAFIGTRGALVTAALMGTHGLFLGASGWSVMDGGSILYMLLTFWFLWSSTRALRTSAHLTVAGIFWALTVYNYLLWVLLTPCCVLFYFAVTPPEMDVPVAGLLRKYGKQVAYFSAGIAITTSILALTQYLIYGGISNFFFEQNVSAAFAFNRMTRDQLLWGYQTYAWIPIAGWIVFPIVTFLVAVVALVRHFLGDRLPRLHLGLILTFSYAFLSLAYMTARPTQTLQFDYYASMLIPLEFMVLGILVFRPPQTLTKPAFAIVLTAGLCISVAPLWKVGLYRLGVGPTLLPHYILALLTVVPALIYRRSWAWTLAITGLSVASFGLIPAYPNNAWVADYNAMAAMKRVATAIDVVDANTPIDAVPSMWFDNNDNMDKRTCEYRAIMCASLSHLRSMLKYPEVDTTRKYTPGTELILLTKDKEVFDAANAKATAAGMPLRLRKQVLISGDGVRLSERVAYWMTFTEVLPPSGRPTAP